MNALRYAVGCRVKDKSEATHVQRKMFADDGTGKAVFQRGGVLIYWKIGKERWPTYDAALENVDGPVVSVFEPNLKALEC